MLYRKKMLEIYGPTLTNNDYVAIQFSRAFNQFISYLFLPIERTKSNDKLARIWFNKNNEIPNNDFFLRMLAGWRPPRLDIGVRC